MRDCARKLFRSLGELRDAQVMMEWLKELHPEDHPLKTSLLARSGQNRGNRRESRLYRMPAALTSSAGRNYRATLGARIRRVPADGDAARCLALERLEEAKELHRRAMRTETPKPWHALRIGVKHFRYSVESLLPSLHSGWAESLKRVQDILGNIHDLDVLAAMLKEARAEQPGDGSDWLVRIERERQENLETYRQLALGQNSVWQILAKRLPARTSLALRRRANRRNSQVDRP